MGGTLYSEIITIDITIIKPSKKELNGVFSENEQNLNLIEKYVQEIDRNIFRGLNKNDVLFLDTSHTLKLGGDLNYIAFHLLPILQKGVKIHIHDIYYPFEYPAEYYYDGKHWNEIYFWKAFLMYNNSFEIELFNSYFEKNHKDFINEKFPTYFEGLKNEVAIQGMGSSLWLNKM